MGEFTGKQGSCARVDEQRAPINGQSTLSDLYRDARCALQWLARSRRCLVGFGPAISPLGHYALSIGLPAAILLISALLPALGPVARANDMPAVWKYNLTCPCLNLALQVYGFPSCQAAADAGDAFWPANCSGEFGSTCTSVWVCGTLPGCPTPEPAGGASGRFQWQIFNCVYGTATFPICPDFATPTSTPNGVKCSLRPYSRPRNLGQPKTNSCSAKSEGNPVNPAIGNKFQMETDYTGTGPFPLKFLRYYNSLGDGYGAESARMGKLWTHTYSRRLIFFPAGNLNDVAAAREDGKVVAFSRPTVNDPYASEPAFNERLQRITNGWTLINEQDETETYDSDGKLSSITNRSGLMQILVYDANARLASVTDPFGRSLLFGYDNRGRLQSMTTPDGAYQYTYTNVSPEGNNLKQVTYPDTKFRIYLYELFNFTDRLTGITDENGIRFSTYGYDASGLASSTERAGGADKVTIVNDTSLITRNVSVTRFVSATQSTTRTYTYESIQGVAALKGITGAAGPTCGPQAATNDANANVTSRVDWNGNCTTYGYDLAGRNLETSRVEGRPSSCIGTTPQTRTITTEWHPNFRLVKRIAEPLRITTNVYNGDSGASCGFKADGVTLVPGVLCSKTVQATIDASGASGFTATLTGAPRIWSYTYNASGRVLTAKSPRADLSDALRTTTYAYYPANDLDTGRAGQLMSRSGPTR